MRKKEVALAAALAAALAGVIAARGCLVDEKAKEAKPKTPAVETAAPGAPDDAPPPASSAVAIVVDAGAAAPEKAADVLFSAKWGGSGLDELGRTRPMEANPEAPMSVGLDGKGRMYVLDQVNGRVVRVGADGKPETEIPLKQQDAAQDMAVTEDGKVAVLDRFNSKSIVMYDENGSVLGEVPLEGEGLDELGHVTGVFVDGEGVFVEKEHGPLLRIGTTSGQASPERSEVPGRPTRDGLSYIKAGIIEPELGRMYISSVDRTTMEHRFTREYRQGSAVRGILLLDTDKSGTIYLATLLVSEADEETVILSCHEPLKGILVGTAVLPVNTMPEETFRDMAVLDEGGVVYSVRTEEGVSYKKYDCQ
ncbi:hypothetical protein [Polyangium spumosum]|uniref:Cyclic nucleotide-binding domain-containing protein n=1 Tax=Polyangium spumosum TaxID=889282 RepID=A0A6N7PP56_9BACT|nr:hypothetical protein [Polyangium spumosum]MRG90691.1 hypothetical protein [Polyangium spumosum]